MSNIDGGNFLLSNVGTIRINTSLSTYYGAGGQIDIYSGHISCNDPSGFWINWGSSSYLVFSGNGTVAAILSNNALTVRAGVIGNDIGGLTIDPGSGDLVLKASTGHVGINNSVPVYSADISGDCNITGVYRVNGAPLQTGGYWTGGTGGAIYYNGGNVGIGMSPISGISSPLQVRVGTNQVLCVSSLNGQVTFQSVNDPANTYVPVSIQASNISLMGGNVGVATTTPTSVLHIKGPQIPPSLTYGSGGGLSVDAGGVELAVATDTASPWSIWLQSRVNSNTYFPLTLNPLGGNVGINTTNPGYALSVAGDCNITGTYRVSGTPIPLGFNIHAHNVTASRAINTNYGNPASQTMLVTVDLPTLAGGYSATVYVDGLGILMSNGGQSVNFSFPVPVGSTYSVGSNTNPAIGNWVEWY